MNYWRRIGKMSFILMCAFLFALTLKAYAQEDMDMTKMQLSKDEIPITTSSQQAMSKYIEGRDDLYNGQVEKAKDLFNQAISLDPNFALAYLGLAQAGGGFNEENKNLEKAENLSSKISEGEKLLISLQRDQLNGNIDKMKKDISQLLDKFPKDKRVELTAGIAQQFILGDNEAAAKHYQKAIDIDNSYAPAYNLLGYAESAMNNFSKAEDAFKKYISLLPDSPNPYDSYAELLLKNGKYDESIEQYKKALDIDPAFISSIDGIGNNYLFKGDFAKAREYYQMEFDKAPTTQAKLNALASRAISFVREGNTNEALSTLDKRISIAERNNMVQPVISSHNMEGMILAESGKPDQAMNQFDMAQEKIESSQLPNDLKDNLMRQVKLNKIYGMVLGNKVDAALAELQNKEQVVGSTENPQTEKNYEFIMGLASLKQNKFDDAISHFSKADGNNPLNWYYQAVAYQKKGDTQKSQQLMDRIKQSNQNSLELAIANNQTQVVSESK